MILWSPSKPEVGRSIDVSINARSPWDRLSAEYQHGQIPVPGMKGMFAECVVGLMEGLKLIGKQGKRGKINPGYFQGPGRKRALKEGEWMLGWSLDGRRIGLGEANRRIFIPSYVWLLDNKVYDIVANLKKIAEKEEGGVTVYDGAENNDPFEPWLSAASVLASYCNGELAGLEKEPLLM